MIVCIVDTSVVCELLAIPGKTQQHDRAVAQFAAKRGAGHKFLLPLAVIVETGNHVAQVNDGTQRRKAAEKFATFVRGSLAGQTPFTATPMPTLSDVERWISCVVEDATRSLGLGDRSLIELWEKQRDLHRDGKVYIWSYDTHLGSYGDAER